MSQCEAAMQSPPPDESARNAALIAGFTLIEMSIVLVIIGLVVGGVLVGRTLIKAAEVRAQITQLEKFNTATNTFYGKYGALPGDIPAAFVTQFGFQVTPARAGTGGRGDGNGLIEGICYGGCGVFGWDAYGEPLFFWEDLSANAGLIEGSFSTATDGTPGAIIDVSPYLPPAKLGRGNYIFVYSANGVNYYCIAGFANITNNGNPITYTALTVREAYTIDLKIDDGYPQSGRVQASYDQNIGVIVSHSNVAPSAVNCYGSTSNVYSIAFNDGAGVYCALSIQFQ